MQISIVLMMDEYIYAEYEETESYRITEMFINNRQMLLDKLLTD